jgi:hypothetical protein
MDCHDRQAQGGPKNLAAHFTMRAIKSQSFHIRLLLIQVNELDVNRLFASVRLLKSLPRLGGCRESQRRYAQGNDLC